MWKCFIGPILKINEITHTLISANPTNREDQLTLHQYIVQYSSILKVLPPFLLNEVKTAAVGNP